MLNRLNSILINVSIIVLLLHHNTGYGQTINITGTVYNISEHRIPFSSIGFYKKDTLILGTIADSLGNFKLSIGQGNYTLKTSALNIVQSNELNLTRDTVIHIILSDSARILSEVIVKGFKPAIEHQVDRTIFNVQNSLFKSGLNAVQLLRQAPRLEMSTNDAIKMIGRDRVRVMINGRLLNLSESAILTKLSSLRSDNILKVEIIPTPSSKYSAEGNVGYINIILKQDETDGFQFRPFLEYTQRQYPSSKVGIDINYKSSKINLAISPSYEIMRVVNNNQTSYNFDSGQQLSFQRSMKFKSKNLLGSLILVYSPTKKFEFGLIANAGKNKISSSEQINTFYKNTSNIIDSSVHAIAPASEKNNERGVTSYAEYKINSLGKRITLTYNNSVNTNAAIKNILSELFYQAIGLKQFNELQNTGDVKFKINSSMLDIELPYRFAKVETGLSYTQINNSSFLQFESQNMGRPERISTNDAFNYYERTMGAYASLEKSFNKLSAKTGLRYERSNVKGASQSTGMKNIIRYDKLFPTVNLSYGGMKNHFLSLAYTKRIQRPSFYYLNPFRYYTSPYAYTSGNSQLQPVFTDNIELMYIFKSTLTTIASYSKTANGISYVSLYQDGYNYTIPQNNFTQQKWDLTFIYQKSFLGWWAINPVLNFYYSSNRSTIANTGLVDQNGFGGMLIVTNTFTLSKSKSIFVQGNYYQFFPSQSEFQKTKAFGYLSSNIRFPLFKKALQCTVSFSDFFKTNRTIYTQKYNNYMFKNTFDPGFQNMSISVSYLFGNKKLHSVYRASKNAEKNRTYK